nr:uncharacterized protein LOC119164630 [Rhipicephalus microplus]
MKQESCDGDVLLRPRSCSSSSTPESDLCRDDTDDNGYYDFPMDLRKKSPKSPNYQSGDEESHQHRQENDAPEDLSSNKSLIPETESNNYKDQAVKRAVSCSKLFEITSESLVERLMRARCKSDSEIQNRLNSDTMKPSSNEELSISSPPPRDQRSPSLTLKRRILGGIKTPERGSTKDEDEADCKQARVRIETISKPDSRPCSPICDPRAPQETLLQQLRHLAPAALPLSIYAYYTQIMQRLHEHELLKRHLEGIAASGVMPNPLLAQVTLASPMAPGLEPLEEQDELGPAAGNHLESYNCGMRKRAPRALTGKHVKHGTGASPSTLLTLRQKIQERQRARQLGLLEPTVRSLKGTRKNFSKGSSNGKKQAVKK